MRLPFTLLALAALSDAQTGFYILLASMQVKKGHVTGGKPANFTNRPSFTPTGRAVLFTPLREDKQAGTYRYNLKTCQTERLTKNRRERSRLARQCCRRQNIFHSSRGGRSDLQALAVSGGRVFAEAGFEWRQADGYSAFADARTVAVFVLSTRPTLQLADTGTAARKRSRRTLDVRS